MDGRRQPVTRLPLRLLPRLLRDPVPVLDDALRGRDVVRVPLGRRSAFVVNEPELIRRVLGEDARAFARFGPEATTERRLAGASAAVLDGDAHARRRVAVDAVFEPAAMTRYAGAAVDAAAELSRAWRPRATVDLERELTALHLETIGRIGLGPDRERVAASVRALYGASREVLARGFNPAAPLLWRLPLPLTRRFDRAHAAYHAAVQAAVDERRRAGAVGDDLLGRLLVARDGEGGPVADRDIRDELWTYLAQGAPVYALLWAWWMLAREPEADAALRTELGVVLGGRHPGAEDYPRLEVTRGVLLEALRLQPTSLGAVRRAARPVELGAARVPEGSLVLVSYRSTHRDGRHWPEAERFDPRRDLGAGPYLAFSAGRRACPARSLATLVGTLQLATLAQRWRPVPLRRGLRLAVVPFVRPRGGLPARLEAAAGD